jgi:hypothetical protein
MSLLPLYIKEVFALNSLNIKLESKDPKHDAETVTIFLEVTTVRASKNASYIHCHQDNLH